MRNIWQKCINIETESREKLSISPSLLAVVQGTFYRDQSDLNSAVEMFETYCRAAKTILAFLSLRLCSLFSALSSHVALPPTFSSSCSGISSPALTRSSSEKRVISEGALGCEPEVVDVADVAPRVAGVEPEGPCRG